MDSVIELIQQFWVGFGQGQLPDLGSWNYMLVGFFMIVQGRATALFGGIAAAAGYFPLVPIILVALTARIIVDLFWYNIGSNGRIDRFGRRFGSYQLLTTEITEQISKKPRQYILLAKLSNGLSLPAIITAGTASIPYRSWLPASFVGEMLWTVPLLLVGYFATGALDQIEGGISFMTMGSTALFVLLFIVFIIRSKRRAVNEVSSSH